MKRASAFLVLVGADLLVLALLIVWYLGFYQPHGGSFGGVMGQMMGTTSTDGMALAMPEGVWVAMVGLAVLAAAAFVGLGYFMAYPEIRPGPPPAQAQQASVSKNGSENGWEVLIRTAKPEEKKVLEVLAAHDGSYLQKFVAKEAGLSKLKTHRIVSRLAERGVVSVERSGNTNKVSLAPWVKGGKATAAIIS